MGYMGNNIKASEWVVEPKSHSVSPHQFSHSMTAGSVEVDSDDPNQRNFIEEFGQLILEKDLVGIPATTSGQEWKSRKDEQILILLLKM